MMFPPIDFPKEIAIYFYREKWHLTPKRFEEEVGLSDYLNDTFIDGVRAEMQNRPPDPQDVK